MAAPSGVLPAAAAVITAASAAHPRVLPTAAFGTATARRRKIGSGPDKEGRSSARFGPSIRDQLLTPWVPGSFTRRPKGQPSFGPSVSRHHSPEPLPAMIY